MEISDKYEIPEYFNIEDIDEYYLNAPIEKLNIGTLEYRILRRNNIRTIRQLAALSIGDLQRIRNLGRRSLGIILDELKKYDIYPRPDDEEKLLYGYPMFVKDIVSRKYKTWENYLFINVLIVNLDWMRYYRNFDMYKDLGSFYFNLYYQAWDRFQPRHVNSIESLLQLVTYVTEQILKHIEQMTNCLKEPLREAIGNDEQSGDESKIISVVEDMIFSYRNLVELKQEVKSLVFDEDYQPAKSKLIGVIDGVFADIDDYYQKLISARRIIIDVKTGKIQNQIPEIDMVLSFSGNKTEDLRHTIEEIKEIELEKRRQGMLQSNIETHQDESESSSNIVEIENSDNNTNDNETGEDDSELKGPLIDIKEMENIISSAIAEVLKKKLKVKVKVTL